MTSTTSQPSDDSEKLPSNRNLLDFSVDLKLERIHQVTQSNSSAIRELGDLPKDPPPAQ
jgi:hypothetical protein